MWQTWWAAQGRKQPTYSTHCLIHCPSLQADSASVLLLVVSWVIYNRLAPFLSFYSNHAAFWYPSLITRNNCSQKRVPKSPGDGSEWSTVQLETSLLTFVPFLTSSARNATGGTRKQANKQTENALFGNRKLLCKLITSQRGAAATQGPEWGCYISLHLQPVPLISPTSFPPAGACSPPCVGTQSPNQQPLPSSSVTPGERLRGAVGAVSGGIPTPWPFYTHV